MHSLFLCPFSKNTIRVFLVNYAQYTHYSRTIDGQYTHNRRTIPYTSSEDEDTIPAFTPYTLHSTPYTITFVKIAVSFSSLIPTLIPPRELRETTEGTPKEDHMTKKALFLRLSPKKVD